MLYHLKSVMLARTITRGLTLGLTLGLILGVADFAVADCPNGGVHIILPDGERVDDCTLDSPLPCYEGGRPWYMHEHFDYYGDIGNPTYEVEEETAWPGQREEFSDYLFR